MYSRRQSGCARWLVGPIIVIGAVVAFLYYQSYLSPQLSYVAVVPTLPAPGVPEAIQPTQPVPPLLPLAPRPISFKLSVSRAGIFTPIVEIYYNNDTDGWNLTTLDQNAGHLQGTATIGQGGNAVLAAHVELKDGTAGPFAHLDLLGAGDRILILSDDPKRPIYMQYIVSSVISVQPDAIGEIRNHGHDELTLITCENWDQRAGTYLKRIVVHAQAINSQALNAAIRTN